MLSNGIAMEFKELTEEQWSFIKPLLPPQPIVGRKRADDRKTLNGILYVLVTGCRWRDMPRSYGAYQTVWRRHKSWSEEGIWRRILSALQEQMYELGRLDLNSVAIDSTLIESKKGVNPPGTTDRRSAKE
jgi:transposase